MYNIVIKWQKNYIPHNVFSDIKSFNEALNIANKAAFNTEFGTPKSINIFENHKCIVSLRTIK